MSWIKGLFKKRTQIPVNSDIVPGSGRTENRRASRLLHSAIKRDPTVEAAFIKQYTGFDVPITPMSEPLIKKSLIAIENLTSDEEFRDSKNPLAIRLSQIYRFAHIARGQCHHEHIEWEGELNSFYAKLLKGKYQRKNRSCS
jgi:hypothetical protein